MAKRKRTETTEWPKDKGQRQHNGQKKKDRDNTMAKRKRTETTQWPKEKGQRQHNDQKIKDKRTNNDIQNITNKIIDRVT